MTIIEKAARAIYNAQLDHFGKYRGNVDTPYEDLSEGRQGELAREAWAAILAYRKILFITELKIVLSLLSKLH